MISLFDTVVLIVVAVALLSVPKLRSCEPFEVLAWQPAFCPAHVAAYDALTYDYEQLESDIAHIKPLLSSDSLVLDIGCGKGHHVGALPTAVGLDVSPTMISAARNRYPSKHFVHGDACKQWLFQSDTVTHALLLYYTIYYFENKHRLFQNIMYWLQPGGVCLVHVAKELNYASKAYTTNLMYTQRMDETNLYETFTIKGKKHRVVHQMFFESFSTVKALIKQVGFILISEYQYKIPNQYLLVFQKPN